MTALTVALEPHVHNLLAVNLKRQGWIVKSVENSLRSVIEEADACRAKVVLVGESEAEFAVADLHAQLSPKGVRILPLGRQSDVA